MNTKNMKKALTLLREARELLPLTQDEEIESTFGSLNDAIESLENFLGGAAE